MAPSGPSSPPDLTADQLEWLDRSLVAARSSYYETPEAALGEAVRCYEIARSLGADGLCARARAVQAAVTSHRGDLAGALELLADAERHWQIDQEPGADVEISALKAQLSFFTGAYGEAVRHAERAVTVSDQVDDHRLRIYARRTTCMVFGNLEVDDLGERIETMLELTLTAGDAWEEAISRNDLAQYLGSTGDLSGAERQVELGLERLNSGVADTRFAESVLRCTYADILLQFDRPAEALAETELALELLAAQPEPNPYVVGATVRAEVDARMAVGELDQAKRSGESALNRLGDRVPHTRSLILSTLARALRDAGRHEEAYDALERAADLEREAFRELSSLQLKLERATLEADAARRESDQLAATNRTLARGYAKLSQRTSQLEGLHEELRDQADRDWLTGLYNRRFLARELERLGRENLPGPVSLAVLDLDHFKSINDRFGHDAGDQVLVRVSQLLTTALRGSDMIVRSGGEEFVLLMPQTDTASATICCERICELIRREPWEVGAGSLRMTASAGLATSSAPEELGNLVKVADRRLYEAKHGGRDRVVTQNVAGLDERVGSSS